MLALNFFEAGRRVRAILYGRIVAGGVASVVLSQSPAETFEVDSPTDNWRITNDKCEWQDAREYFSHATLDRNIVLCFRNQNGQIAYEAFDERIDPQSPLEPPPIVRIDRQHELNDREPHIAPPGYRAMVRVGNNYSPQVKAYISGRLAEFRDSRPLEARLEKARDYEGSQIHLWNRLMEALPWVVGLIVGTWAFTAALGWVLRGLLGIPQGKDTTEDNSG